MQSDICHYDAEIKDRGRLRCRYVTRYFPLDEILYDNFTTLTDLAAVLRVRQLSTIWISMMTTISCLGKDKIGKVRTRTIHA